MTSNQTALLLRCRGCVLWILSRLVWWDAVKVLLSSAAWGGAVWLDSFTVAVVLSIFVDDLTLDNLNRIEWVSCEDINYSNETPVFAHLKLPLFIFYKMLQLFIPSVWTLDWLGLICGKVHFCYCHCLYFQHHVQQTEKFSYLILTRGQEAEAEAEGVDWARLIAPVQRRTRHVHCRLCTQDGQLQHLVVTARKHSRCPIFF